MNETTPDRTAESLRYRQLAVTAANTAQAQYEIALLDHATARILDAFPEATHLTFDHHTHTREIELAALWTTHHGGTEERLLDTHQSAGAAGPDFGLDLGEITDDLCDALAGLDSVAWSAVRPDPRPDRRWVLDLPPADRAGRIAELVRAHHPQARLLAVDVVGALCRSTGVVVVDAAGRPRQIRVGDCTPLWPADTELQITALARQIHALPHLRAQHLARIGGPQEPRAFLLLPEPGPVHAKKELS